MMAEDAIPELKAAARRFERDDELASALAAYSSGAWRQLFEEQYAAVHAYAYLRTGNRADADDIASATFTAAVKGIGRFGYRGKAVAAWLFGIAHNETVDLLKRRKLAQASPLDETSGDAAHDADAIGRAGERRDLSEAMAKLNEGQRAVVLMRLIEGRSVAETAAALGKSEGSVKVTQMRALRKLRRLLQGGPA